MPNQKCQHKVVTPTQKLCEAIFGNPPQQDISESDMPELIMSLRDLLDGREYKTITWRFGIKCTKKTRIEVSAELGLSSERIRQLENKALRKLRHQRIKVLFATKSELGAQLAERDEKIARIQGKLIEIYREYRSLRSLCANAIPDLPPLICLDDDLLSNL